MNKILQKFQAYDRSTHYIQERIHIHFCHRQRCLNFLHGKNIGSAQWGEILSKRVFSSDELPEMLSFVSRMTYFCTVAH